MGRIYCKALSDNMTINYRRCNWMYPLLSGNWLNFPVADVTFVRRYVQPLDGRSLYNMFLALVWLYHGLRVSGLPQSAAFTVFSVREASK